MLGEFSTIAFLFLSGFEIIKIKAVEQSKLLYPTKNFLGSSGWCYTYKIRWNLTTVSCSISRKATTTYTIEELNLFLKDCKTECERVGTENFYNSDEMKCNNINISSKTIHIKGTNNAKINVNGNEINATIKSIINNMMILNPHGRQEGWWLQQLLKLYSFQVIKNISSNILIVDSETIFYNKYIPIKSNKSYYAVSNEVFKDFRVHMKHLLNDINFFINQNF